ncbi:MAG: hypothetical protein ACHQ7N_15285 [Candidatus Methylomirabilales bacterium]
MEDEVRRLQDSLRQLEEAAAECLGNVRDPLMDTATEDGRTLRQLIYSLSDHYREHMEQLLWTKWGQRIPRSESKRALAELQGARAQFAAYFTDLRDEQLDIASAAAQDASPRDVILHVLEEEKRTLGLIRAALGQQAP